MKKEENLDNDWAKNVDGSMIHISKAPSGKKGYNCLGCGEAMQAVHFKFKKYRSYFRHDATNVDRNNAECVKASRTYREKIARDYFFRVKQISLPVLFKYPSKGQDGSPNILKDAYTLIPHKIKSELTFYEDVNGSIKYGKNPEIEDRYNLIRPDLSFFDESGNPILLIELVITHKVNDYKKDKIRRLGIDCVQVIVPKKETLEIEKHLAKSSSYKWLYNEIEANTSYIPVFGRHTEEISPVDEEQRRLFEESITCRKSQLSNLIRSINRCIQTESYRSVERNFESEISRIEKATVSAKSRLEEMERDAQASVYEEFEERIGRSRENKIQKERDLKTEEEKHQELERRYSKKVREIERESRAIESESGAIEQEQVNYDAAIEEEREYLAAHRSEEEIREDVGKRRREVFDRLESSMEEERRRSNDIEQRRIQQDARLRANFEAKESELVSNIESDTERERERAKEIERKRVNQDEKLRKKFEYRTRLRQSEKTQINSELEVLRISTERIQDDLERIKSERQRINESGSGRLKQLQEHIAQRIDARDTQGDDELSAKISSVLQTRRLSGDFENRQAIEQEYIRISNENKKKG